MKRLTCLLALAALLGFGGIAQAYTTNLPLYVYDSPTGGDCTLAGVWDAATKTCTLTDDVYTSSDGIDISSDNITIDGNGHLLYHVDGGVGLGVFFRWNTGITIKNLVIRNFWDGIRILNTTGNTIENNVITDSSGWCGIWINQSNGNRVLNNLLSYNSSGIGVTQSGGNYLGGNTVEHNTHGIYLSGSYDTTIEGNKIHNNDYGIRGRDSTGDVSNNTISDNYYGTYYKYSAWGRIYNNNFINNYYHVRPGQSSFEINYPRRYSLDAPIGGNYWSDFDTPEEGCGDLNADGFCDSPYTLFIEHTPDYLPWTKQDGWLKPASVEDIISLVTEKYEAGEITNAGIYNSLLSKLNNAIAAQAAGDIEGAKDLLQAFINQVTAQAGKHISESASSELVEAANLVMAGLE